MLSFYKLGLIGVIPLKPLRESRRKSWHDHDVVCGSSCDVEASKF